MPDPERHNGQDGKVEGDSRMTGPDGKTRITVQTSFGFVVVDEEAAKNFKLQ